MTQSRESRWQVTLRGLFLIVTAIFVFGYQRHQIRELREEASGLHDQLKQKGAQPPVNPFWTRRMTSWREDRSDVAVPESVDKGWRENQSDVGVPESVDKGMLFDAVRQQQRHRYPGLRRGAAPEALLPLSRILN